MLRKHGGVAENKISGGRSLSFNPGHLLAVCDCVARSLSPSVQLGLQCLFCRVAATTGIKVREMLGM